MHLRKMLSNIAEKGSEVWLVASWDVVRQARRPIFFFARFFIAMIISIQFVWLWGAEFGVSSSNPNAVMVSPASVVNKVRGIYTGSMVFLALGIIAFCPLLTVGCIAGDRERNIWYDIVNSPLSGWTILLGKMAGRLATVFSWVLSILPVWAILGLVGGLDPVKVLCGFVLIISYGWFYAAIGLFASTVTSRTRDAMALSTAIIGALVFLPVFIMIIMEEFLRFRSYRWLWQSFFAFNPLFATEYLKMFDSNSGMFFMVDVRLLFCLLTSMGPLLTLISGLILRKASQRLERSGVRTEKTSHRQTQQQRETVDSFVKYDHAQGLAAIWHCPMAIKERKIRSGSRLVRVFVKFVVAMILLCSSYFLIDFGSRAFTEMLTYGYGDQNDFQREIFGIFLMIASGMAHFALVLSISIDTAGRLVSEKESDAWVTLISTPIEPREIFFGKAIGAIWAWRWLYCYILSSWALGVITGAIRPYCLLLTLFVWGVHLSFAVALGLRIGSTSTNYQSMLFKVLTVLGLLQGLVPIVMAGTFTEAAFVLSPSISAGMSMTCHDLNLGSRDEMYLPLFACLQIGIVSITTLVLVRSSLRNFDRRNDRIVADPGRYELKEAGL